jgi:hypothetical protein
MTNFKKMVEARMAKTGETWQTAARRVRAQAREQPPLVERRQPDSADVPGLERQRALMEVHGTGGDAARSVRNGWTCPDSWTV